MFANKYLNLPTGAGLKKKHAKSLKPDNLLIGTENIFSNIFKLQKIF